MSLFTKKPTSILYLRRQDAIFIDKKSSVRFDIPIELVQNLEVIDGAKLSELVANFLNGQHCHNQRILLVLDPTAAFHKDLSAKELKNVAAQVSEFEYMLPFDAPNRQVMTTPKKGGLAIFGSNKRLLQAFVQAIQKSNKLLAVVPAALYGVSETKTVDRKIVTALFTDKKPLKHPNFLTKN